MPPGRGGRYAPFHSFLPESPAMDPLAAAPAPASRPAKAPRWYWEDFTPGFVMDLGRTEVTREATLAFAAQFDPQPFHLDDAAAEASLFGRLSASGWHTCAMAMRMMCDAYRLDPASPGSPGLDKLSWLRPVFPGDTLHMRLEVLESRPLASKPGVGMIRSHWDVM